LRRIPTSLHTRRILASHVVLYCVKRNLQTDMRSLIKSGVAKRRIACSPQRHFVRPARQPHAH